MICNDKNEWMQKVCTKFTSLTFQRAKQSIIAYAGGRVVAVYDHKQERGMIL